MARKRFGVDSNGVITFPSDALGYATKCDLVYQHLRDLIVGGRLEAGTHLYLDEIARSLGLSTNPVREALRRLQSEGLVTSRPHQGATVAAIDPGKIEVHFQIRGVLEGLAIRSAAALLTVAALDHLTALHQDLQRLAAAEDLVAWDRTNLDFYRYLFDCSRAPELVALIDIQRDRSPRYRHFPDVLAQRARETNEGRTHLLTALREGDGERAERLHRENVAHLGRLLAAAMQRGQRNDDVPRSPVHQPRR